MSSDASKEFEAIQAVHSALEPLDEDGRARVMVYIGSLLGVAVKLGGKNATATGTGDEEESDEGGEGGAAGTAANVPKTFSSFAELYDQAGPKSNGEKALVVGYWLQVCQQSDTFAAAAANKELMHLGHKVANITGAIDSFKDQKPSLILQLKKHSAAQEER
ncbi:hypothetical protein VC218_04000 [Xanthomonas nasturtii]|uniref:hypothetical protein n=1 Tax=Xanthomonas nasturtii TaxID=1843581 RepID=UPI002B235954|nr:hypothetical protein [Xanthomonas nasturtii]MEA9578111.1 hypothetical protein [Xanthomonas nasturtii]